MQQFITRLAEYCRTMSNAKYRCKSSKNLNGFL